MWGFTVVPLVKAPQSFENWLKGTCSFHVLGRAKLPEGGGGGWLKQRLREEEKRRLERYREVINARKSTSPPTPKVNTEEGVAGFSL